MLGISLGPWLHAEAIGGIVRHFKQFLKSKTSAFDDFWDLMVSKALQNQNLAKICSKIEILKWTLFVHGRSENFLINQEHQNKLLGTSLGPWARAEGNGDV